MITYLRVSDKQKSHMTKKSNLMVISSETSYLKDNKGLAKPRTSGNSISNKLLRLIQQVIGNLVRNHNITQTYVEEDYPWLIILTARAFII